MIIEKVKPIIVYPDCLLNGIEQDCFKCGNRKTCISPRSMCLNPYHGHSKGCPNYGKKVGCPPSLEMFDQIYDVNSDIWAIVTEYNLGDHIELMKNNNPDWTYYQLRNVIYWQGTDKVQNKKAVAKFYKTHPEFVATDWPEALGVNLIETLKQINIILKFPVEGISRRVSLAGIIPPENYEKYNLCVKEGIYHERLLRKRCR